MSGHQDPHGRIDVVLFDFSGTLAEEPVLLPPHIDVPMAWREIWDARFSEPGFADSWQRGEIAAADLVEDLSTRFGTEPDVLFGHIERCSRSINFHPGIMNAVRARKTRGDLQALVTINPDLFTIIADHYGLNDLFDAVVLSANEGTIDKVELCRTALERLNRPAVARSLLIDNVPELVRAFRAVGGAGYVFVDDTTFLHDVRSGRLPSSLAA
jgi:FMN phosphatase YigB (HAD superfamily)